MYAFTFCAMLTLVILQVKMYAGLRKKAKRCEKSIKKVLNQ